MCGLNSHKFVFVQFNRQNAFLQHKFAPAYLPQALLQLFVDIEFTGHAMQFEQKFGKSLQKVLQIVSIVPSSASKREHVGQNNVMWLATKL